MAWNGSGTYTLPRDFTDDDAAGITILAANFDQQFVDIRDALNNCLTRDGQGGASANLPLGGFKHTNVGLASARTDYSRTSQVQDGAFNLLASTSLTGTTGLGGTLNPAITAYVAGLNIAAHISAGVLPTSASTTLNVNGVGATPIRWPDGSALGDGDLVVGTYYFQYNAQDGAFHVLGQGSGHASNSRYGTVRIASANEVSMGSASSNVVPSINTVGPHYTNTFTALLVGLGSNNSGSVRYTRQGKLMTLLCSAGIAASATGSALRMTGIPSAAWALQSVFIPTIVTDAQQSKLGAAYVSTSTIDFYTSSPLDLSAFNGSAAAVKGIGAGWTITYPVSA